MSIRASSSFDCLAIEAERRGIVVARLGVGNYLSLTGFGRSARLFGTITDRTSHLAVRLADDKRATKNLLLQYGLPTPEFYAVDAEGEAINAFHALGRRVAVKPQRGQQGRGVSVDLVTEDQVREAFRIASTIYRVALVERHCSGQDYRVTVVNGRVAAVSLRKSAVILGDGIHSVAELIAALNEDPRRGDGDEKPMTKIPINGQLHDFLDRQGWSLQSVPNPGQQVPLHAIGSISQGCVSVDRTDDLHPELARLAIEATQLIGLDIAGIDLIARDISLPLATSEVQIIEINCSPGLRAHLYPAEGFPRNPAISILDYLFPESVRSNSDRQSGFKSIKSTSSI